MATKLCEWDEGCEREAIRTQRYCPCHRRAMLKRMKDDGYLQPVPRSLAPTREPPDFPVGSRGFAAAGPWDGE
jgi:hypothetical protein